MWNSVFTPTSRTVEEIATIAERLTYERSDGTRVFGLVIAMDDLSTPMDWIRGFGGDFILPDYKVVCYSAETIRGVAMMCDLCRKNVVPRNVMNFKNKDVTTYMQQGRAAMTNNASAATSGSTIPKPANSPARSR